jgi:hypothetical protein
MLNDQTGVIGSRRRAWPAAARTTAAIIATSGLALLASACGSSPSSGVASLSATTNSSSANAPAASVRPQSALALSHCMRSNGVLSFPDPNSAGVIPKVALQQLGVSSSRFQSAQTACQHLLPNGGRGPNQAQLQQSRTQALKFSRCMRTHGVTNFPDPDSTGRIPDPATLRPPLNQGAPHFQAANRACGKYRPPYFPSNAAYNAYARTNG